uniref:Putative copia-type protein n=2 Tax=Tanacetum cinerariifolium TaxID=118510 RepID=A0A699R670_TANCI|nr:putative copia-type protein [Tanacetum cinerariifolium]
MIMNQKVYMEEEAEPAEKERHLETQLFTDADWAGNKSDRRSTSGYFTLVGGNLVTWRSKKQKVVALSNAKAGIPLFALAGRTYLAGSTMLSPCS